MIKKDGVYYCPLIDKIIVCESDITCYKGGSLKVVWITGAFIKRLPVTLETFKSVAVYIGDL